MRPAHLRRALLTPYSGGFVASVLRP